VDSIKKHILTDENGKPIAVQVSYADWVRLEAQLAEKGDPPLKTGDLSKHVGKISLRFDPMEFQQRARSEWP
jgi:hypothetical protein